MANQTGAFGLKAVGKVGQNNDKQGLSEYSIAANDSSTIYFQDPVKASAAGTIDVAAAGSTLLGTLNGVFYTDPSTSKPSWRNYYPGSTNASDIVAFVSDDPYERFEVKCNAAFSLTTRFLNADIVYAAGDSANYVSKVVLGVSTATTSTAQLRVLGISKDPENNQLSNVTTLATNGNVIVEINEHFLKGTTGI